MHKSNFLEPPEGGSFLYAFRQLSEAKQKPTRYAGGDKKLYK